MYDRLGAAGLAVLCTLLLAACGGGGGGGGGGGSSSMMGGSPGTMPGMPDPPGMTDPPMSTRVIVSTAYGAWNERLWVNFDNCRTDCTVSLPAGTYPVGTAYTDPANYRPEADRWTATWSGPAQGYRAAHPAPGLDVDRRWAGTVWLEIRSGDHGHVYLWGDLIHLRTSDGLPSGLGVSGIPDSAATALRADITDTDSGRRAGFFAQNGIIGQFIPSSDETGIPPRVIGHIEHRGNIGVFAADRCTGTGTDPCE